MKKTTTSEEEKILNEWIANIAKRDSHFAVKKHLVKHTKELFKSDPLKWSASMRNLIEIFERQHKLSKSRIIKKQLERLYLKYLKNPRRYTSPPKGFKAKRGLSR